MLANLGFYPDHQCYDPNRWSWLPYWINNVTEQDCLMSYAGMYMGAYPGVTTLGPMPPLPAPPPVGQPPASVVGGTLVTPAEAQAIQDKLIADETAAWKKAAQDAIDKLAAEEANRQKGCPWYQEMNSSDVCQTGGWKLWAVAIGGVAAMLYLKR